MNRKKRIVPVVFCLLLLFLLCLFSTGCQQRDSDSTSDNNPQAEETLSVVCTAFPQYDWVREILGERESYVEVTLLNRQGTDMHSFQPTARDMIQIAECDLLLYIGGFSESWVDSVLRSTGNNSLISLPLLEHVEKKEEILTEGMDLGLGNHDSHDGHDHDSEEETEYDEHIWLSLRCAQDACDAICQALCRLDPSHAAIYQENLQNYRERLQELDNQYMEVIEASTYHTILVADRFPFRYLADDYNLTYYAAFPGCSAETEASFDTVIFLAEKADDLHLPAILVTEGGNPDFAQTVVDNTENSDLPILTLDSMQSIREADIQGGVSYLSIMESNLQIMKAALN